MQFLQAARNVTHLYGRLHIKLNSDFKNDYNSLQQHGIHFFLIGNEMFYHHILNQFRTNA